MFSVQLMNVIKANYWCIIKAIEKSTRLFTKRTKLRHEMSTKQIISCGRRFIFFWFCFVLFAFAIVMMVPQVHHGACYSYWVTVTNHALYSFLQAICFVCERFLLFFLWVFSSFRFIYLRLFCCGVVCTRIMCSEDLCCDERTHQAFDRNGFATMVA